MQLFIKHICSVKIWFDWRFRPLRDDEILPVPAHRIVGDMPLDEDTPPVQEEKSRKKHRKEKEKRDKKKEKKEKKVGYAVLHLNYFLVATAN